MHSVRVSQCIPFSLSTVSINYHRPCLVRARGRRRKHVVCVCLCACVQAPVDPSISLRQTILRGRLHTNLFPGHAFAILAGPLGFLVTMRRSKQASRVRQTLQHAAAESPSASFPSLSLSSIFPCCQLPSPSCIFPVIPRTLHIVFFSAIPISILGWSVCLCFPRMLLRNRIRSYTTLS
ncbi:uncharacterized protein K489DRAFT_260877 [Dissoconium aciculare CBS 342.82]|uniref:Uncharacterized protein n=1 Tax=Dissoconium aciculare CBS 342.82 TaxID=1314786 RepID=A0A6J3LYT7_9PEZI|nr:uncharacterized protein K489DRAFT_260877 [Dissoconium aciculare CBS 342.82]KAF1820935.1 hypothetical protein K489DRAFT_260877 [Dissoconium aciculare CBS 342.82]